MEGKVFLNTNVATLRGNPQLLRKNISPVQVLHLWPEKFPLCYCYMSDGKVSLQSRAKEQQKVTSHSNLTQLIKEKKSQEFRGRQASIGFLDRGLDISRMATDRISSPELEAAQWLVSFWACGLVNFQNLEVSFGILIYIPLLFLSNSYPIYKLLECVRGLILQNQINLPTM